MLYFVFCLLFMLEVVDHLPQLEKRELLCLLLFTCNYVVSFQRDFLFLWAALLTLLAHLSRRLKGELIVYRSIRRASGVRPSVRKHFQTRISPQPVGQS